MWQLIVRSHEGPDARDKRSGMEDMDKGYTIDHVVKAGKLITLFSAPDYPQFQVFLFISSLLLNMPTANKCLIHALLTVLDSLSFTSYGISHKGGKVFFTLTECLKGVDETGN